MNSLPSSKICSRCKVEKSLLEFSFQNKELNKRVSHCKPCNSIRQKMQRANNLEQAREKDKLRYEKNRDARIIAAKEYRKKYPERIKYASIKAKYGLSKEQYFELVNNNGGKCSICSIDERDLKRGLFIDHSHQTGKVRGLLCDTCNKFLGFYEKLSIQCEVYLK